ncbi:hypothetical protein [Actinomycetospora lemnae]|uniref:Uncharacterized protein n=1 Tax=Actinomycetospora lemnae TaxID=3019891 RepID=A0ABT5STW7_9PSEU|nr:hypothetical protein [Actinomycetospora sp. DW7H6]MDD7965477.1 hypothetical protein [Actinomycetospora sp. DW7H6]
MSPAPIPLGNVDSPWGPAPVLHRSALAVEPRDGITGGPAVGVRVGRETRRSMHVARRARDPLPRYPAEHLPSGAAGRAVLTYDASVQHQADQQADVVVRLRLDDPVARWVPRRLDVVVRGPGPILAAEEGGPFVPAWARRVRPWLLPGPATSVPRGATTLRFRVVRPSGAPVPWVRAVLFAGALGARVAWGHGDRAGEVLLVVADAGAVPVDVDEHPAVLRVYGPPTGPPPDPTLDPRDPLATLPPESLGLVPVASGATGPPPEDDLARGITPPAGYRAAADQVVALTVGRTRVLPDQTFVPRP